MKFKVKKIDNANASVTATFSKELLEEKLNNAAKVAAKTMDVQGFRKGKVPVAIVKQRYGQKLEEEAQGDAFRTLVDKALEELKTDKTSLVGEPNVTKFDKKEDGLVEVEFTLSSKPIVDLGDYKSLVPEVKTKKVTAKEIDARLEEMASSTAPLVKIKRKRAAKAGDHAVIDFEGFKDGVAFDGGKADGHTLEIGSNSFIPGFEDQVIGMKYDEQKDITVTFPKEYQSEDLAGAEVVFKVTLHEIQEKGEPVVDDEFAKKVLPQEKDVTVDVLKEKVKEQIKSEKMNRYYSEELKPAYLSALVDSLEFDLPATIVEQEVSSILNDKVRSMSEDEINKLKDDQKKIEKMRKEVEPDAIKSVKATFIIDELSKIENVEVTDQEVTQVLYYEAMQMGQDPKAIIDQYTKQGYMPAIKMQMIETKVINKLLDEKSGKK